MKESHLTSLIFDQNFNFKIKKNLKKSFFKTYNSLDERSLSYDMLYLKNRCEINKAQDSSR